MPYHFTKQIEFLLEHACTGIRFLVYRDFLQMPVTDPAMHKLYGELLEQKNVRIHLDCQHPDGWFGEELHGGEFGMERSIGALLNVGVEKDHPAIQKGIHALITPEIASQHKNWFHGGDGLDAEGRGGNNAVTAAILSWVGYDENYPVLSEQTALAWEHVEAVCNYNSVDEFTKKGKNERYYKPYARFPGANHIALLNATQSWRSDGRMETAKASMKHAYELMKDFDEYITFRKPKEFGGSFVGPFNYNWQALKPADEEEICRIMQDPYNFRFAFWLGAVTGVPDWVKQHNGTYEVLADMLERNAFPDRMPDNTLRAFRRVCGKEPSYRKKQAAECDITYAVLRAVWGKV